VEATEEDIVLTERVTGVPLAVIRTPYVERLGTRAGPVARWMLRGRRLKKLMRTIYALWSGWKLKRSSYDESGKRDFWQAGRSVAGIDDIRPTGDIIRELAAAAREA
jgi:nitronate monooxygenase